MNKDMETELIASEVGMSFLRPKKTKILTYLKEMGILSVIALIVVAVWFIS